jgi:hypothetical protein
LSKLKLTKQKGVFIVGKLQQPGNAAFANGWTNGLSLTFKSQATDKVYTAEVNSIGSYSVTLPVGRYLRSVTSKNFKPVSGWICIRSTTNWPGKHVITVVPTLPPRETFKVRGYIKNGINNKIFNDSDLDNMNVTVTFVDKLTLESFTATRQPGSVYQVELPKGNYNRTSGANKYAEMTEDISVSRNTNEAIEDNIIFLSPSINGYRAILVWNKLPQDLDAHVILPTGVEVNFDTKSSADKHVTLDVDALKGYGPETVSFDTIAPGVYKYYVQKFSNEDSLTHSGAIVRLFKGSRLFGQYRVPTVGDTSYDYWHVFNIDTNTANGVQLVDKLLDSAPQ